MNRWAPLNPHALPRLLQWCGRRRHRGATQRWWGGSRPRRSLTAVVATGMLLTATVVGCGGQREGAGSDTGGEVTCQLERTTRITIATGNATGVYYAIGGALADQITNAEGSRLRATAAETGASVQNIQQVVAGEYQVAFSLADTAADAVNGEGAFDEPQPIEALARIYTNYTHVIVRADSGIESVADMAGARVSTGSPNSGTEVIANRLLQAAGLDPASDLSAQRLDLTSSVDALRDGTIDALFWSGGLPTPGITDLFTTAGDQVRFIDITPLLPELQEINPVYEEGEIAAEVYGTDADVPTIVVPNLLVVRDDLDANVACIVTRTLFESQPELAEVNSAAEDISLQTARATDPVPLHRGAVVALDELGAPDA